MCLECHKLLIKDINEYPQYKNLQNKKNRMLLNKDKKYKINSHQTHLYI